MKIILSAILLLLLAGTMSAEGDQRFRLQRRLPDCRGTLENYYIGDEFDFYNRLRYAGGSWRFIFLMDKARGEQWVDVIAGGVTYSPPDSPVQSVSAGWLKADLGSGLVFSFPGRFSSISELSLYKPPNSRNRIEPATSPWGCRGEPLTGAGAIFSTGGMDISILVALSRKDSTGSGYHRTESEIDGRGAHTESLAAARVSGRQWGITAAAASENTAPENRWLRCGFDWNLDISAFNLSGEVCAGFDSTGTGVAGWGAFSQNTPMFRHMLMGIRNPASFPADRSSPPISRECDTGISYGFRWKAFPAFAVKAGAGTYFIEDSSLLLASIEAEYRFPWSMEAASGIRTRTEKDEGSWRCWIGTNWQPQEQFNVRTKIQLSGWRSTPDDSSETGAGIELKFRYTPNAWLTLDLGSAACSTDGYNSRIYAGGSSFPGVFASTALYDRTFFMFFQISAEISDSFFLRGAVGNKTVENAAYLGSGWEETEGDSRTELGFQLDYAFQ